MELCVILQNIYLYSTLFRRKLLTAIINWTWAPPAGDNIKFKPTGKRQHRYHFRWWNEGGLKTILFNCTDKNIYISMQHSNKINTLKNNLNIHYPTLHFIHTQHKIDFMQQFQKRLSLAHHYRVVLRLSSRFLPLPKNSYKHKM